MFRPKAAEFLALRNRAVNCISGVDFTQIDGFGALTVLISSPVNHLSFRSDLKNAFDWRQSLPEPIKGGVGGEVSY